MHFPVLWSLSVAKVQVGVAGPHQLDSRRNLNLLKQINKQVNKGQTSTVKS